MQKQIGEKAIEFNQDTGGNDHPNGCQNRRSREVLQKVVHKLLRVG